MSAPLCLQVIVNRGDGLDIFAGSVVFNERLNGWRFIPRFQGSPSRRVWDTPRAAIGRRLKDYRLQTVDGAPADQLSAPAPGASSQTAVRKNGYAFVLNHETREIADHIDGLVAALTRIAEMRNRDGVAIEMHRDELRAIALAALAKGKQ